MQTLNARIARFYDASSQLWEDLWGEHMHHGFYPDGKRVGIDRIEAQETLIEKLLQLGEIRQASSILDVGCGIGGSGRYLAEKLSAEVTGISLSPFQVERAQRLSEQADVAVKPRFQVADAQSLPFADNSFDLVWSMESAEHFPNKAAFLNEAFRVLQPNGSLLLATWCCDQRPLATIADKVLLSLINRAYALPPWAIPDDYDHMIREAGFVQLRQVDWSLQVKPFWKEVLAEAFSLKGVSGLLRAGPIVVRGAAVVPLMMYGFARGTIRFIAMSATKPASEYLNNQN